MSQAGPSEIAILAGGCFWGVEQLIRQIPGVQETTVGYCGGATESPTYPEVKTGKTGHAEAIQIRFDTSLLSYDALLDVFFRLHDPTTKNQQGNDIGSQYRSAIFYLSEKQRIAAEAAVVRATQSGRWKRPIVTEIVPEARFWSAEDYHQDYLVKNPNGYNCHYLRD